MRLMCLCKRLIFHIHFSLILISFLSFFVHSLMNCLLPKKGVCTEDVCVCACFVLSHH